MSLATRCTACGTIFRVVQDQLRVSEGWVRCGRCAEVFDAREQLFDIDREAPPPWPAQPAAVEETPSEPISAAAPQPRIDEAATWVLPREEAEEPQAAPAPEAGRAESEPALDIDVAPSPSAAAEPDTHERREPYWNEPVDNAPGADEPPAEPPGTFTPSAAVETEAHTDAAGAAVSASFLRQAESARLWQRSGVRLALLVAALLLTALLAWQVSWQFRDALHALFPQSAPVLRALCATAGCELQPWRRIDVLTVETSSLTVAGNGNNYKLKINLHNKAAYTLALPWVDLSLTDANGAVVARRMLKPADFNLASASIGAHAEETLQLLFSTGTQRVSGYSIEIFHP